MITMVASSLINLFFDWLLIVRLHMGMAGAATANLISNLSMTLLGFIVFSRKNSEIKFAGLSKNIMSLIIKSCSLGLPQLLTTVAISVNAYISNNVIQNIAAEDGTAAYAIANNIQFMFTSGIFGLSSAVSPLISYAYGEKDFEKIVRTVKKCLFWQALLLL